MRFTRLYTGSDGKSHIEELSLESHPNLTELQATAGIIFRSWEVGGVNDWHTAPRRQYVIHLSGQGEVELEDGSIHRFGPGDVTLAEDLTGKGHITRTVGDQPRGDAVAERTGDAARGAAGCSRAAQEARVPDLVAQLADCTAGGRLGRDRLCLFPELRR